jgi:hypothetical protein
MRDGVSIHQERRREPIVKEGEFSELPNLQAFLKLPGAWPVTKIELRIKKRVFDTTLFYSAFKTKYHSRTLPKKLEAVSANIQNINPIPAEKLH